AQAGILYGERDVRLRTRHRGRKALTAGVRENPRSSMPDGQIILVAGALLAAALAASLLAGRIRVPGLVLFLGLGMLIGSDGLGCMDFEDFELAESIGVVALALILFEGGLAAGFGELRPVLRPATSL